VSRGRERPIIPYSELSTQYCVLDRPAIRRHRKLLSKSVSFRANPWLAFSFPVRPSALTHSIAVAMAIRTQTA
jgi:hypothetical protein